VSGSSWKSLASDATLETRALMLKSIRAFFDARDVLEVETPQLSMCSTTDPHLDSLQARFRDQRCYLNTSPEYGMKRLLAGSNRAIYQVCKSFRDDEPGQYHNPEFTMLEWYRPGYGMEQLMQELKVLVTELCKAVDEDQPAPVFDSLSYRQAFEQSAGFDPHQATSSSCMQVAKDKGVEIPQGLGVDDDVDEWLDWLLTQLVLPSLRKDRFTFIYDYPASQCSLARIEKDDRQQDVAKRFELLYGDLELANGFYELTDAEEQLQRFNEENGARLKNNREAGRIDNNLIDALRAGLAECSGVAVGLDRLLMVLTGADRIEQVLSFSWGKA
jgi:lysyl-tRNA synthetase class 2